MEKLVERRFAYNYYGTIEFCNDRLVISPDWSKPTAFGVNYSSISLPLECYKDINIQTYKGQHVVVNAYWVKGQWNEEYEVFDAKNFEKKTNEQQNNSQVFIYLTLEDLVPNALIQLVENDISRIVSYSTILQYGDIVIQELEKRNINAILLIYKDKTIQFEDDYKEIFDFFEIDNIGYVKLKDNINTQYLRKYFRTHQSLDTLIALTSNNSKQALGINTTEKKIIRQKLKKEL